MSKVVIAGDASGTGTFTISAPNGNTDRTLTLPDEAGTVLTTAGVPSSAMPAGSVLQVVSVVKSDTFSTSAGTGNPAIITGFSASITPSSTANKIIVLVHIGQLSASNDTTWGMFMFRNGTKIGAGDAAGSRATGSVAGGFPIISNTWRGNPASIMFLDSPSSTSSVSYTFALGGNSGQTIYFNRDGRDTDNANDATRTVSTITLMEVAA